MKYAMLRTITEPNEKAELDCVGILQIYAKDDSLSIVPAHSDVDTIVIPCSHDKAKAFMEKLPLGDCLVIKGVGYYEDSEDSELNQILYNTAYEANVEAGLFFKSEGLGPIL